MEEDKENLIEPVPDPTPSNEPEYEPEPVKQDEEETPSIIHDEEKKYIQEYPEEPSSVQPKEAPIVHTTSRAESQERECDPILETYKVILELQHKHKLDTVITEKLISNHPVPTLYRIQKKKALDEIFHFYTKQYVISTTKKTFEGVNAELNRMELGFFLKLLRDFHIPLDVKKSKETFVRAAAAGRYVELNSFELLLEQIAFELYAQCIKASGGKLGKLPKEKMIELLDSLMGLYDVNTYRKLLKGFKRKAFNTQDVTSERIPHQMIEKYKTQPKEVTEMLKEKIATQRRLKEAQNPKKVEPKKHLHTSSLSQIPVEPIIAKKNPKKIPKKQYTIEGLGRMSYKDLKECEGFDPKSLLTFDQQDTDLDEAIKKFPLGGVRNEKSQGKAGIFRQKFSMSLVGSPKYKDEVKGEEKVIALGALKISDQSPAAQKAAGSIKKAVQADLRNKVRVEKNLQHLIKQQEEKLQKGLGVVKKAKRIQQ